MLDLTVVARGGRWVLLDDDEGEVGAFDSRAEALTAAGDYEACVEEPRHVLIQEHAGEWEEAVVEPPALH
ncbi:MAG: hypothetical protein JWQ52_322 [Phenylobacterium sp.]|jgi:hypothetical protein|nr:hypothetical protein [Phenylobacterium sp.]